MPQTLFINATVASMQGESGYGLREQAALLVDDDKIAWVGDMSERPASVDAEVIDCRQRLLTPGLIDCHTHLVYGGDRADEFEPPAKRNCLARRCRACARCWPRV